jgi:hypothetical protein
LKRSIPGILGYFQVLGYSQFLPGSLAISLLQYSRAIHKNLATVFKALSISIYQRENPLTLFLIPGCRFDSGLELDIFLKAELRRNVFEVLPDLL